MGASLEDLSHPPAARLKIANDDHQISLACVNEYGIKLSNIGSMDEFSAHARGPLRHAHRVVDGLGLADTDEESELQEGDNPFVGRMDLEQHAEFSSIHRRCFLPHFPAVKSRFVSYWLYLNSS